jgi:hypothetical protein
MITEGLKGVAADGGTGTTASTTTDGLLVRSRSDLNHDGGELARPEPL